MRQGKYFQTSFCFSNKALCIKKQVISSLVLIYFGRPQLEYIIKVNFVTFQTDPEIGSVLTFYKRVWD